MPAIARRQDSTSNFRQAFHDAREAFDKENYAKALDDFRKLEPCLKPHMVVKNKIESFIGVSQVMLGDDSGINLCRSAAERELWDAEVFGNLALAEYRRRHRGNAIKAILRGLELDPRNSRLRSLQIRLDGRREPVLPFLNRDNVLNKYLGIVRHRLLPANK